MQGSFSSESVAKFLNLMSESGYPVNGLKGKGSTENFSGGVSSFVDPWDIAASDFEESRGEYIDNYDFRRCVRANGTVYGTSGKCRKGTEAAEEKLAIEGLSKILPKGEKIVDSSGSVHKAKGPSLKEQIESAYEREVAARKAGDAEGARKAMKEHMALVKEEESRKIMDRIKAEKNPQKQRDLIRQLEQHNNPLVQIPGGRVARSMSVKSPYED
jgi:hypothetical protein